MSVSVVRECLGDLASNGWSMDPTSALRMVISVILILVRIAVTDSFPFPVDCR
jgi:hypothetical protein